MSERVAIVVGAGGELGRVTAEKLAAAGFTVAGVDRSEEALKDLPDSIWREAANNPRRRRPSTSSATAKSHRTSRPSIPPRTPA